MPPPPSTRTTLIRATTLAVINDLRKPATTADVISAVLGRIEDRKAQVFEIIGRHEVRLALEFLARGGLLVRHTTGDVESTRVRRSGRKTKRAIRGTISWSLPGVVESPSEAQRLPCPTCPWRKSVPKGGFPGGIIDVDRLMRATRGGASEKIMQCHCSRDSDPKVCVGFVLQVGRDSVACRLAAIRGRFDPEQMGTDEELHSLESLLRQHGGRVEAQEVG